ncbi:hypothetical protein HPB51_000727 [Rhipicephalus microplus]|uniref:THAP-type domain-containing protein n=1 Tax=Rhipicephalus microplus TaxID=6941 RepID=A0A9J6E5V4_RHIMP|nr:hypothetical protein HPB51_000727 [Rhipicephalus microplus]
MWCRLLFTSSKFTRCLNFHVGELNFHRAVNSHHTFTRHSTSTLPHSTQLPPGHSNSIEDGKCLANATVRTEHTEAAEEVAIALALVAAPEAEVAIRYSQAAVRGFARGRISCLAARILQSSNGNQDGGELRGAMASASSSSYLKTERTKSEANCCCHHRARAGQASAAAAVTIADRQRPLHCRWEAALTSDELADQLWTVQQAEDAARVPGLLTCCTITMINAEWLDICLPDVQIGGGLCKLVCEVFFHRFPKDAMIYKKWIVAIKRDEGPEFQVGKSTKVGSKHFRSSDFIPSVVSGRSLLRDSAVPSVFAFSKEKKERKPPKPRASPQVRSQNPVLGPGVLGDELMHSPDEVKAAPVGLEKPTRLNSSLEGENAHLAETIKQKNHEIARLRDELCQIKEQLVDAKGIIGQLGFEKVSLSCQLAAERERTAPFTVERFKDCDEDMLFYTGLPSYNHFKKLLVYLNPGDDGCNVLRSERTESSEPRSSRGRKRKLSTENELFLVLVRLRLGLFEDDLAHRRIVDATMPPEFKEKYSSTRVILDATEIQCEVPSSLFLQSTTYSPYKSSNTFKGLIGVLPNGLVAFVSELFTGSSSDRECVIRSGF